MPNSDPSCQRSSLHRGFSSRDNVKFAPCSAVEQFPAEHHSMLGVHFVMISPVCTLIVGSWCLSCLLSFLHQAPSATLPIKACSIPHSQPELPPFSFDTCMSLEHLNFTRQILIFFFNLFCSFQHFGWGWQFKDLHPGTGETLLI